MVAGASGASALAPAFDDDFADFEDMLAEQEAHVRDMGLGSDGLHDFDAELANGGDLAAV